MMNYDRIVKWMRVLVLGVVGGLIVVALFAYQDRERLVHAGRTLGILPWPRYERADTHPSSVVADEKHRYRIFQVMSNELDTPKVVDCSVVWSAKAN